MAITRSVEEYLQAVYRLQQHGAPVSTTALAAHLQVAPPSVTGMVRQLDRRGLVEHVPYQGVTLTTAGRRQALRLLRIHRLWELFLTRVLDLPWDQVHYEAHRLEHATSEEVADRLAEYLNHPESDPHGQPIPRRDGTLPDRSAVPLSQVPAGSRAILVEVPDGDSELLRYLGRLNLYPGAKIEVVVVAPFGGPLTLEMGGRKQAVGRALADQLLVATLIDLHEENHAKR